MKWYTKTEYVDRHSGEILKKEEVEKNYIIKKKKYATEIRENWGRPNWSGTRTKERYGIRTITIECEREGKQLKIWKDS